MKATTKKKLLKLIGELEMIQGSLEEEKEWEKKTPKILLLDESKW